METLASVRPAEWPLANCLDPVGWISLRTALRGTGHILHASPQVFKCLPRAQSLVIYPQPR